MVALLRLKCEQIATVVGTGANAKYITYLLGQGAFIADSVAGNDDMEVERTASTV